MSTQSAALSKLEQNPATSEPGADQASVSKLAVPSRTRRFFIELEIGVKKTRSSPGGAVGLQSQQEAPVVQPVLAFGAGGPRPPAPALDAAAPVPGNPVSLASTGSGPSTSAVYIKLSVGDTVTPPDPGGGGIRP